MLAGLKDYSLEKEGELVLFRHYRAGAVNNFGDSESRPSKQLWKSAEVG